MAYSIGGNLDGSTIFIPAVLFFLFNMLLLWGWFRDGKGGNCLILDGHWLVVPSLFQMYKNCSLFNAILLLGWCRDGEGWKLSCPGGKLAVVTILTPTVKELFT